MKILVTGFYPFGQDTINPALEAVKQLPNEILGASIIKLEIPTMFHQSSKVVNLAIQQQQPDIVVHIGQAGGRFGITPERIAINLDDARIPDNARQQPIDQVILENGPAAYFSQLPVKAMVANMQEVGIPATVSNSAGTFVCNHIMYQTLHYCQMNYPQIQSGFIHVPYLPQQVADKASLPSMDLKTIVQGLVISIETIITYQGHADIKTVGGSLH